MVVFRLISREFSLINSLGITGGLGIQLAKTRAISKTARFLGERRAIIGQWPFDPHSGRKVDESELSLPAGVSMYLCGASQRFDRIADYQREIREAWLKLNPPLPVREAGDFLICIGCGGIWRIRGRRSTRRMGS